MSQEHGESLYAMAVRRAGLDVLSEDRYLPVSGKNLRFAMACNGYFQRKDGQWVFNSEVVEPFSEEFKAQQVAFFGPSSSDRFFSGEYIGHERFIAAFDQEPFLHAIAKCRGIDEGLAARIAYIYGGVVRHLIPQISHEGASIEELTKAMSFASQMSLLGERRSGDAIASAMAMYIISGASLEKDVYFEENVARMARAIERDPVYPLETQDLGLSQALRLWSFINNSTKESEVLSAVSPHMEDFRGFPTVGAEFHFSADDVKEYPNFWKRLAILNMSQYQRGSYVQMSRNDRGVVEMRMNPSIQPVTLANWNHMRLLFPELNKAFFILTLNRKFSEGDFNWIISEHRSLLDGLRAIGMLTYAGLFNGLPDITRADEINFGEVYLGQTVRIDNGKYVFSGYWGGKEGRVGQFGIYAGFGDNFPLLSYYLSMVLAKPDILNSFSSITKDALSRIKTLDQALNLSPTHIQRIFNAIQIGVENDGRLRRAFESRDKIVSALNS